MEARARHWIPEKLFIAQRKCCCCCWCCSCCCCWSISTNAAFKSNEDGDDGTMVGGKLLLLFAEEEFIRFVAWRTWWESTKDWFFGGRPGPRFFVAIRGRSRAFAAPGSPWESLAAFVIEEELGRLWRVWPADCFIIDAGVPLEQLTMVFVRTQTKDRCLLSDCWRKRRNRWRRNR